MSSFKERAFLIRALVGVFVIQFATVFYQVFSCRTAILRQSDKTTEVCSNASNSFNETGKLALTTFLALLVPASNQVGGEGSDKPSRKPKTSPNPDENKG